MGTYGNLAALTTQLLLLGAVHLQMYACEHETGEEGSHTKGRGTDREVARRTTHVSSLKP